MLNQLCQGGDGNLPPMTHLDWYYASMIKVAQIAFGETLTVITVESLEGVLCYLMRDFAQVELDAIATSTPCLLAEK